MVSWLKKTNKIFKINLWNLPVAIVTNNLLLELVQYFEMHCNANKVIKLLDVGNIVDHSNCCSLFHQDWLALRDFRSLS